MRNMVDKSGISLRIKYFRFSKGYIALGIVNALHCQLRIDNGGLEYMCTWCCVFSDILAIHRSIWT